MIFLHGCRLPPPYLPTVRRKLPRIRLLRPMKHRHALTDRKVSTQKPNLPLKIFLNGRAIFLCGCRLPQPYLPIIRRLRGIGAGRTTVILIRFYPSPIRFTMTHRPLHRVCRRLKKMLTVYAKFPPNPCRSSLCSRKKRSAPFPLKILHRNIRSSLYREKRRTVK